MEPDEAAIIGGASPGQPAPPRLWRFVIEEASWLLAAFAVTVLATRLVALPGGAWAAAAPGLSLFGFDGLVGAHVVRADRSKLAGWLALDRGIVIRGLAGGGVLLALNGLYGALLDALGIVPPDLAEQLRTMLPEAVLVVWAGLLAPVVEELYFRGRLLDALDARLGPIASGWITSVLFAAVHGIREFFPAYLAFACVLLYLRRRTGGLSASIAAHVLNNVFALYAG